MTALFDTYDTLRTLAQKMAEEARACQWEALGQHGEVLADILSQLQALEASTPASMLSAREKAMLRSAIEEILRLETEVRASAEPWLDSVRTWLGIAR